MVVEFNSPRKKYGERPVVAFTVKYIHCIILRPVSKSSMLQSVMKSVIRGYYTKWGAHVRYMLNISRATSMSLYLPDSLRKRCPRLRKTVGAASVIRKTIIISKD